MFALAGMAEAAMAMEAGIIFLAVAFVGVVALVALGLRSKVLAVIAAGLLLAATLILQPWMCFSPFEAASYADPDVRSFADTFKTVGVFWVLAIAAVAASLLLSFLAPKRGAGQPA